jgi:mRNA-degrading endonuclease RelE of RelBE toxin-antitoxin system
MKLPWVNKWGMSTFSILPEFEKELKKLSKKYPTLPSDIEDIKPILTETKTGIGKNFTIIATAEDVQIVKVRILCESLRARAIRLIYAYHEDRFEFMYIELYFKGDKEAEDKERIKEYLKNH